MSETATPPVLASTVPMHAHRCEACAKIGKEVVWIHPEADFGQIAAHKCPECGTINWKQSKIDNAKLPQPLPKNQGVSFDTILGYVALLVGLALIAYGVYYYVRERKTGIAEVSP